MPLDQSELTDIAQNFIARYRALVLRSPHLAVHNFRCENSDYSDQLNDSRNAYCCFNGYDIQNCYYTYDSRFNKNCADLSYSNKCELCYECIDCDSCYDCNFCQDCENCVESTFCYDSASCQNCFGCVGLRRANYHIFNVPYNKESYAARLQEIKKWPREKIQAEIEKLRLAHSHVAMHSRHSENCFGDYIFNSKNSYYVFKGHDLQDCLYTESSRNLHDCVDVSMLFKSELLYETIEATDNYNCNFLYWCANCRDSEYLMYCFDCDHCFGCFNLKRGKYHILNKPYEPADYFTLIARIKQTLRAQKTYKNFLPDLIKR